jgi:hypothetical protein
VKEVCQSNNNTHLNNSSKDLKQQEPTTANEPRDITSYTSSRNAPSDLKDTISKILKKKRDARYRLKHLSKCRARQKLCRDRNKLLYATKRKNYRLRNQDKLKLYNQDWRKKNKKKLNAYFKSRKISNVNFRLGCILRTRLSMALKQGNKSGSAVKDLGCSIGFLKSYLQSLFQSGMSWTNYGEWHIDHIKPLARFDLTNRKEFLKACNYTNLQPLWAKDNIRKGANFI